MIPAFVRDSIEPTTGSILDVGSVGGGCIASATRIEAANGLFFLKWAEGEAGRTFEAESDGLGALRTAAEGFELVVPEPLAVQNASEGPGFLLMEWLEPGRPTTEDWQRFGRALAELHRSEQESCYGFANDNWIGSKPQRNEWKDSWPDFFGEKRMLAQAETVRQRGFWQAQWDKPLERLVARLHELLPASPYASILHGDLWAGNALPLEGGRFAIIDPAVYVGHREADLAMTELFGGFTSAFYEGYNVAWPLERGYPQRREIYNLFHLINHLTHGPGYAGQVERTLTRFGE